MTAAESIDQARLFRKADLSSNPSAFVQTQSFQRRCLTKLDGQSSAGVEEWPQCRLPVFEELGTEVVPQPVPGVGELPNRRQAVLVNLGRNRPTSPAEPGAEVVEETETDLSHGILSLLGGLSRKPARTRASPGAHHSARGWTAAASTTLVASAT